MSFWRALLRGTGLTGRVRKRSTENILPAPTENALSTSEERPAEQTRQTADVAVPSHVGASSFDTVDPFPEEHPDPPAPTAGPRAAPWERALRLLVERHGTEHPDTITARNNLATKYAQMGRRHAAVQQFELTLDEAVAVYGDEHPRTEIIRENLAWAFEDASRPADAAEQWQILLSERESQFGAADEDTVEARMRLAFCCRRSGQLDEAIVHYEQAIEHVASQEQREELRLGLSASLNLSGRHGEAIQQLRLVLASRRRRKGKGHLDTLVVHHRLGRAHTQAGQANAAVETLREAYRTALNASGDPEVRRLTLRLRRDLAGAYSAAGRPREADALLF
ncbi:MAG TPA: tetratricopeptide repeat protein [Candidatus Nocardiopsis merdipullorum]|nr:tetratricopeptide repeat protein [Candidatus Nocardiopsis merdipullorum]